MSSKWKNLTAYEVAKHPLSQKRSLMGFIELLFVLFLLGMGGMYNGINQIYHSGLDTSQFQEQGIVILFAIVPYLIFAIAFWSLRKKKTKNTLKIIIGMIWAAWLVFSIFPYFVLAFIGFTTFPNELIAKAMGTFVLTAIVTIGLLIYSYFSKVYNLQYLHRIKNENLDTPVPLEQSKEDINISFQKEQNIENVPNDLQDNSQQQLIQTLPKPNLEPSSTVDNMKTTSAKFNGYLLILCGISIFVASPFAYIEYKDNLQCLAKERKAQELWDKNYNNFLYELKFSRIQEEKDRAAREIALENCSKSDYEYYRRKFILEEEFVPVPIQCRKYNTYVPITISSFTPEEEYKIEKPRPYFYCN